MEISVIQLGLIVLYGFFINFEKNSTMFGTYQPVTAGFVTGLILGDIKTGLFIGGTLQLLSLGISNFGGASIPDYQTASIVATFITITTGQESSVGISIGIPVALLMVQLDIIRNTIGIWMVHKAEAGVKRGDYSMISKMQMFGVFLTAATTGIPVALAVIFGPSLINTILAHTPEWLTNGLTVAGGIITSCWYWFIASILTCKRIFQLSCYRFCNVCLLKNAIIRSSINRRCYSFNYL